MKNNNHSTTLQLFSYSTLPLSHYSTFPLIYDEGGDIMPVADLIREEGRKEGIQIGELKGEIKRLQETLIKLISKKYGITDAEKNFIKSVTDLDKLDKATEAILSEDNKGKLLDLLK